MRYWILASALLAGSALAAEATPGWQFYQDPQATNGLPQAFVQSSDGTQLILKCDKPGKNSVYAVLVAKDRLANPAAMYTMRSVSLRYDGGETTEERWRYFANTATAVDRAGERSLAHFIEKVTPAKQLDVRFDPEGRSNTGSTISSAATTTFDVHGAGDAIDKVFAGCKDTKPTAGT